MKWLELSKQNRLIKVSEAKTRGGSRWLRHYDHLCSLHDLKKQTTTKNKLWDFQLWKWINISVFTNAVMLWLNLTAGQTWRAFLCGGDCIFSICMSEFLHVLQFPASCLKMCIWSCSDYRLSVRVNAWVACDDRDWAKTLHKVYPLSLCTFSWDWLDCPSILCLKML